MNSPRTLTEWFHVLSMDVAQLVAASGLDPKVVEAIVAQRYTTSPKQRERIASALGISAQQIRWGNSIEVDHLYGHGPQFGRSP